MKIKPRILALMRCNRECSGNWLFEQVYGRRARWINRSTLKVHIWQLRQQGYPIYGTNRGPSRYEWRTE